MKKTHLTRDGQTVYIAAMENSHLYNFLRMSFGKIGEIKNAAYSDPKAVIRARLVGQATISAEDAARAIDEIMDRIAPYLIEAHLRGLKDVQGWLRETFERSEKISSAPLLPAWSEDDGEMEGDLIDND